MASTSKRASSCHAGRLLKRSHIPQVEFLRLTVDVDILISAEGLERFNESRRCQGRTLARTIYLNLHATPIAFLSLEIAGNASERRRARFDVVDVSAGRAAEDTPEHVERPGKAFR